MTDDDFAKMFAAMMEQGQKMAKAFAPAMENVDVKAFEKFCSRRCRRNFWRCGSARPSTPKASMRAPGFW